MQPKYWLTILSSQKIRTSHFLDLISPFLLAAFQFFLAHQHQEFDFLENYELRWSAILFAAIPIIFLYNIVRLLCPALLSVLLCATTLYVLGTANTLKLTFTGEPLSWTDITKWNNLSLLTHYIATWHIAFVVAAGLVCVLSLRLDPFSKPSAVRIFLQVMVCVALAPLALYPYNNHLNQRLGEDISASLQKNGISYISWDWTANMKRNGLPYHLIQTSWRKIPTAPGEEAVTAFRELQSIPAPLGRMPQHIIMILCESCWHDQVHFKDAFSELTAMGFRDFRAISPVYGGGTVNASFELLTGLPAGGAVSGVIYQEYAPLIAKNAQTYPQYLRKNGYRTIAAHNHYRKFWKRDVINPKFGFDEFIGLEDMNYAGRTWADDSILFKSVAAKLAQPGSHKFLYLTTVYTHGAYRFNGDYGEGDYQRRLHKTLYEVTSFARQAIRLEPDTLILIVGDHKPALTKYFYENGVLPSDQFTTVGNRNEDFQFSTKASRVIRGDVPAYIYHPDQKRLEHFVQAADKKPFFCLSQLMNGEFTHIGLPTFNFAGKERLCTDFSAGAYLTTTRRYPEWLYFLSIFADL